MSRTLLLTGALDVVSAGLARHAAGAGSHMYGIESVRCMFWPGSDLALLNPAPATLKVFIGELTHGPDLADLYAGVRDPVQIHFVSAPNAQVPLMWYMENLRAVPVLLEHAIRIGVQRFVLVLPVVSGNRARGLFARWCAAVAGRLPAQHILEQALFELRLNSARIQAQVMYVPGVYGPGVPLIDGLLDRVGAGGSVPVPALAEPSLELVYTGDLYRQLLDLVRAEGEPADAIAACAAAQLFAPGEFVLAAARLMRKEFGIAVPDRPRMVRVPLPAVAMAGVLLRWLWRVGRHNWALEWLVRAGAASGSCSGLGLCQGSGMPESALRATIAGWVQHRARCVGGPSATRMVSRMPGATDGE